MRKAILENWRVNDVKSKNAMNISEKSKVKNQMKLNILDFEKEKVQRNIEMTNEVMQNTGISQTDLQGSESPIPARLVNDIQDKILSGKENTDSVTQALKIFNFTVERFKQVYMKDTNTPTKPSFA